MTCELLGLEKFKQVKKYQSFKISIAILHRCVFYLKASVFDARLSPPSPPAF